MSTSPPRYAVPVLRRCAGCGRAVAGRCPQCANAAAARAEIGRLSSRARGYTKRWEKARAWFLGANPLCAICAKAGRTTAATVVDHIDPHKGDDDKFWDQANWQPLCKRCHDRKTATTDGGFGR